MISSYAARGRRIIAALALLSLLGAWPDPAQGQSDPGYSWSWTNPVSGEFSTAANWITSDPDYQTIPYSNDTSTVAPPPGDALNFSNGATNYTVTMSGASSSVLVTFENGSTSDEVWNVTLLFSQNFQATQLFGPATNQVVFSGGGVVSVANLFPGGSSLVIDGLEFDSGNIPQAAPIFPGDPLQEVLVTNGGKFVTQSNVNLYGITVQGGEWDHNGPGDMFGVSAVKGAVPQITIDDGRVAAASIFFDGSGASNFVANSHVTTARNNSVLNITEYSDGAIQLESGSTLYDQDVGAGSPIDFGPACYVNAAQWIVAGTLFANSASAILVTNGGTLSAGALDFPDTNSFADLTVVNGGSSASCTALLVGTAVVKAAQGGLISFPDATLTLGSSVTSDGSGSFVESAGTISGTAGLSAANGATFTANNVSLTNGSVYASSSNTTLTVGGTLNMVGGSFTANGAASASISTANLANASFSLDGAGSIAQVGALNLGCGSGSILATVTDGAILRNTASGLLDIGQAATSSARLIIASQANLNMPGDCYVGDAGTGSLWVHNGAQATVGGSLAAKFGVGNQSTGAGAVTVSDPGSFLTTRAPLVIGVTSAGSVFVTNGASVQSDIVDLAADPGSSGTLLVSGAGSAWVDNNNLFVGGAPSAQPGGTGMLVVQSGGTLRAGPLLYISASGLANVTGGGEVAVGAGGFGVPGTLVVTQGGELFGQGTIQGQVIMGGIFDPGGSQGLFSIQGNYQQEAGGELDIVVGGNSPGDGFSQLNISGSASLGGTLNVILVNGFQPSAAQSFQILVATNVSGTFSQVNGASVTYSPGGVTVNNVIGVTAPAVLSIQWVGQALAATWPATVQDYSLQTTSNVSSGVWQTIPTFANTYVIGPVAIPTAFFRLIHN